MVFYGFNWFSMVFYGFIWFYLVLYGFLWFSMVFYGFLCFSMVFYGFLWFSMVLYGWIWFYNGIMMVYHGLRYGFIGIIMVSWWDSIGILMDMYPVVMTNIAIENHNL